MCFAQHMLVAYGGSVRAPPVYSTRPPLSGTHDVTECRPPAARGSRESQAGKLFDWLSAKIREMVPFPVMIMAK